MACNLQCNKGLLVTNCFDLRMYFNQPSVDKNESYIKIAIVFYDLVREVQ